MVPAHAPLPTDWSLPFHPVWPVWPGAPSARGSGNHTSIRMSESLVGWSAAVTRQNAGRLVNAGAAAPPGGTKPPVGTSADVSVVLGSGRLATLSHVAAPAGAATVSVARKSETRSVCRRPLVARDHQMGAGGARVHQPDSARRRLVRNLHGRCGRVGHG